jgi:hypothetical protein
MNEHTILLRQIHPTWIQQGNVTSQAFRPTTKDSMKLSVYDGDQINAEQAWLHYTSALGHESVGTMGVTVGECASMNLPARPDPQVFPEHAVIDFTGMTHRLVVSNSKLLRQIATIRDWLHRV